MRAGGIGPRLPWPHSAEICAADGACGYKKCRKNALQGARRRRGNRYKSRTFFKVRLELEGGTRAGSIIKVKAGPPDMENEARRLRKKDSRAQVLLKNTAEHFCSAVLVGEGGFEPPKALPADLQSVPFGHSGIPPYSIAMELVDGFEPPTC